MSNFRKNVSKNLARLVRDNKAPWQDIIASDGLRPDIPINPATGKQFNGVNSLILTAEMIERGSNDPRFMTVKSIEEAGYTVSEDSKSVDIEYWSFSNLDANGEPEFDYEPAYNPDGTLDIKRDYDLWPTAFSIAVFHASDIDGIEPYERGNYLHIDNGWDMLETTGVKIANQASDNLEKSFYDKEREVINTPLDFKYKNSDTYFSSMLFHAGEHILNKLGVVENVDLSAQIFAGFAASQFGKKASTEFIDFKDYADCIEADHGLIFRASANAKQAFVWVNDIEQRHTIEMKIKGDIEKMGIIDFKPGERVYLTVPYEDKDDLKQAVPEAKWERNLKSWYVPKDTDPALIAKWDVPEMIKGDFKDAPVTKEFAAFIKEQGFDVGENGAIMDGAWHNVPFLGETTGKAAMYMGSLGSYSSGQVVNCKKPKESALWTYTGPALNANDIAEQRQKWSDHKIERAERLVKTHREASVLAHQEMSSENNVKLSSSAVVNPCTILVGEGLCAHNAMMNRKTGDLMIGVRDIDGNLTSVQYNNGVSEGFIEGSKVKGCFHMIDNSERPFSGNDVILVAGNYFDAASVHEATGRPVINALEAGNLEAVVNELNDRYDGTVFVLGNDKDNRSRYFNDAVVNGKAVALYDLDDDRSMNQIRKEDGVLAVNRFVESRISEYREYAAKYELNRAEAIELDNDSRQEAKAGMGMGD